MKEYLENIKLANKWAKAYYLGENPLASDAEYDALMKKIKDYESLNPNDISPDSPTQKVLPINLKDVNDGFNKLAHLSRMYSMEDVFNEDELHAWIKRAKAEDEEFFIEPKFDGASLNLIYENGKLIHAITRGDGSVGDDITLNAMQITSIPKSIAYKELIEIRGEIVILKDDFLKLNEIKLANNESLFSNPRNAASGSLRLKEPSEVAKRNLQFYPHGIGQNSLSFTKHSEAMEFIRSLGFLKDDFCKVVGANKLQIEYENLQNDRLNKKMMLDGFVLRINDLSKCTEFTSKFPKFMAAYKFEPLEQITKLIDVSYQVGRTGVITPVGTLEPTNIDGAIVKSVTLHNYDEITRLDLMINDSVSIIRSGDVIPKLTRVYKERRDGTQIKIPKPINCPSCNEALLDDGALIKCINLNCKAKMLNQLIYFASKKCLNIDGLGDKIIELLFKLEKISTFECIYELKYEDFQGLEGFADKKITNILTSIEKSKDCELASFINALGCEHIGEVAASKVASEFGFDWYLKDEIDYLKLDGFGEQMAKSIANFCVINKELIIRFYEILRLKNTNIKSSDKFANTTFVITGTLSNPREYYENIIKENGGKTSSSVSKKTSYLLCGDDAGSKLTKAKELGIKILNEDEFKALL
ncbi:NAD-dependent DNA ligase LigA [Campylobacter sp. RM12642]|uniref:NAD-dependent DNA ligase LigA n=1 Tax=Campylobacter sp. RM12642 TaxID=2735736 RepID=UPI0030142542|nr:NAD-dependent DNA ligase LigA [Campylobacter sp. RM12642]